jgi:hypothetical protein
MERWLDVEHAEDGHATSPVMEVAGGTTLLALACRLEGSDLPGTQGFAKRLLRYLL